MIAYKMKLSEEQAGWVTAIQNEYPNIPAGYARAMVEMFLEKPEFFEPENLEKIEKETVIPQMEKNDGYMKVISEEESNVMYENFLKEVQARHNPETILCQPEDSTQKPNEHPTLQSSKPGTYDTT